MQANKLLSIVIPTYNRAELLDYCLGHHISLVKSHNISIFIFDNASTDATEIIVKKRIEEYPLIEYYKNKENVGELNFELALKHPVTKYVWLMGDSYIIPNESINYLIDRISSNSEKYDMFLFNIGGEVKNIPSADYSDQNLLLHDLCWLMTCMSCLVYSSKLIAGANFPRYRNTNFIQTGIIFEYIANSKFKICWKSEISVKRWANFNNIKKESWQSNFLEIWFRNRANFIFSLPPSYSLEFKLKSILEVGFRSTVSIKDLIFYRFTDVINYKNYNKYKYLFPVTVRYPSYVVLFFSIIPKAPIGIFWNIKKLLKKYIFKSI